MENVNRLKVIRDSYKKEYDILSKDKPSEPQIIRLSYLSGVIIGLNKAIYILEKENLRKSMEGKNENNSN